MLTQLWRFLDCKIAWFFDRRKFKSFGLHIKHYPWKCIINYSNFLIAKYCEYISKYYDHIYIMQAQHFKFIHCLERLTLENRHNEWFNCFHMTGLSTLPMDCYKSGNGKSVSSLFSYLIFSLDYTLIVIFTFAFWIWI
jgi:hypothetical protein